jgi:hypothetical protein
VKKLYIKTKVKKFYHVNAIFHFALIFAKKIIINVWNLFLMIWNLELILNVEIVRKIFAELVL